MDVMKFKYQDTFEKVSSLEVKRTYVLSQLIRDKENTKYMPLLTKDEFILKLKKAKNVVMKYGENQLDWIINVDAPRYKRRLRFYNTLNWFFGVVTVDEVGVWKGAGGLPVEWTTGSLQETAELVKHTLETQNTDVIQKRAKRAIPSIINKLFIINKEKYLSPIIMPPATNGRGLHGRPYEGFSLMTGDIEDGCMRSIANVINGKKIINAYIGIS